MSEQRAHSGGLRDPGRILLISCYELGHQPIGLASPLAFLERAGFRPAALDIAVEPLDTARVRDARFVGISVPMHTALRLGVRVARRVRELNPTAHLCFYGLYAPLHAEYLRGELADSILGGECEASLVELVERIDSAPADSAPRTRHAIEPIALQKLDFAVPSRASLPPLERYARLEAAGATRLAGYVEASRGCSHLCKHCPIPAVYAGRFFVVPIPVVVEDVRTLVRAGATHITFGDADFLNGPSHALRVAQAVHGEFPHLTFDFTAKIEHLLEHRALLPELAALGALFVVTALESLSDLVLENLQKGHTRAGAEAALRLLRHAGIPMRPSLLPFTPWSTLRDYVELLDWLEAEDLIDHVDPVQLTIRLLVPPGSLLLASPAMQPHLGALDAAALTYAWTHPDPQMDDLQRHASQLVEQATREGEDSRITFRRLRQLATGLRGAGDGTQAASAATTGDRLLRPPRLTEPWFCCAEPTAGQLDSIPNLENPRVDRL